MSQDRLVLGGLDGSNPLAFLAALGTLRIAARAWSDRPVTMSWSVQDGKWTPALQSDRAIDELLTMLDQCLIRDATKHPIAFMHGDEQPHQSIAQLFRDRVRKSNPSDREGLDWLSAMCSDLATEATSQLQTARRDYFWGNLQNVVKLCNNDHLRRTLFKPWDYADPVDNQSLHIEPSEDRRHAHQWSQPSGDPERKKRGGMLGANRLAIEAFPLFQSTALGDKLSTRGFTGVRANDTRWTWPLWDAPATLDIIISLLGLNELQSESPDSRALSARGVVAVFRCRRILVGKTPNFTPATAV